MPSTVTTTVTELPESRVRVEARVTAAEVERRVQQAARELGRQMRIPGFRKGKVPPPVVIRRLGREAVLDEALRGALGGWYVDAIDQAGISPVGEPELDVPEQLPAEGQPLSFSIEIGVRPRAKLGRYRGLEVGRREPRVEDSAIDEELERLRDKVATLETATRPAQHGDHVLVDYVGIVDGEPFEGGEGRDQLLELGAERLVEGFGEQLVGAGAGEQRTVYVTFPEGVPGELAGKQAEFDVAVKEVKAKRLPELDDELASEAAGLDTLAELRDDIGSRLRQADERAVQSEFEQAALDAVVDEAEIELPERLIHARAHELVEQMLSVLGRQGISTEAYLQITGRDEETLVHEAEPEAANALRREAVLAAIVASEQLEPSDEELVAALEPAAQRRGADAGTVLARLREDGRLDQLRDDVASRQALELVVREAKPISVEQAQAREKLWTPGKEEHGQQQPGQLWTPGA